MRFTALMVTLCCCTFAATHHQCQLRPTNFEGWKAEELSNDWVRLTIVPQVGGRLMQVTFAGHSYLFVNPQYKGQYFPRCGVLSVFAGRVLAGTRLDVITSRAYSPAFTSILRQGTNPQACGDTRRHRFWRRG